MTLDTLTFTMPDSVSAEAACDSAFVAAELGPLGYRLERLRNGEFVWMTIDSLSGLTPGYRASVPVDISGCAPCAFRVWCYDAAGNVCYRSSNIRNLWEGGTPVGVGGDRFAFRLGKVVPMPVVGKASVSFSLAATGLASVELFDLAGRRVLTVASGVMDAGDHLALFDARRLKPGVYAVRLRQSTRVAVSRIVVLR